ncbi:uncharacterized protein C8Q71DRAFT_769737 [Rhodofomes roseus]|uniref:HNH nuclease domain-containing protein n=1 Tax=Rhodofomes roseus TaxID=34475 RepID=A0ABQ8KBQ9_9APHY|nr:uncharacterized protein C8Q71DRAFT_769737 [Rhodofomes roseus]KAH9834594.1 hypothetical protein C8Q71DRAFT_769737 [Rhodofomes roseus]
MNPSSTTFTTRGLFLTPQIHCSQGTTDAFNSQSATSLSQSMMVPNTRSRTKPSLGLLETSGVDFHISMMISKTRFVKQYYVRRDGGQCIFTGSDDSVDVHWTIPPPAYMRVCICAPFHCMQQKLTTSQIPSPAGKPWLITPEHLKETSNLLTMRPDIHELWDSNSFSVDVNVSHLNMLNHVVVLV